MSSGKKKGLGRGLSALFGDQKVKEKADVSKKLTTISIGDLSRNPYQPRDIFDEDKLEELSNSIKKNGIIQPIAVRLKKNESNKYEIVAGERRWLAAQKAGLHEVPVLITEVDDLKSLEFAIIENVQRQDLNAIEEAKGYQRLIDDFKYDQEKVAKFIGKSRSHITNCLRLLTLPNEVLNLIENQKLTPGHAKVLVGLNNVNFIARKIIDKKLSVRQTENFVKIFKVKKQSFKKLKDPNLQSLEMSITDKIGLNVLIKNQKNNNGSITFEYKDIDQLNKIIEIIKANY